MKYVESLGDSLYPHVGSTVENTAIASDSA